MSAPAIGVPPQADLDEVVRLLERHHIKRVLVLDKGRPVGMVSRTDLLRAIRARGALPRQAVDTSDAAVRAAVMDRVRREHWADGVQLNVQVNDGAVTLWGAVEYDKQRDALRLAVEEVPGVKSVESHLVRARAG